MAFRQIPSDPSDERPLDGYEPQTDSYQNSMVGSLRNASAAAKSLFDSKFDPFLTQNAKHDENDPKRPAAIGQKKPEVVRMFFGDLDMDLLVSKMFYFFFYAAFGSLFPLISIYFKQLGMDAVQAGLLVGVRPFIELASVPMWGFLSDKYKRAKFFLLSSVLCWIIFTLALNFVHPVPPYCLVDNGTYATLQTSKLQYSTADNMQYDYGSENTKYRAMDRRFLYVEQGRVPGMSPVYLGRNLVENYPEKMDDGDLIKPPYSTKVYRKSEVGAIFMLLLLLIIIGEFFSAPAITLANSATLAYLGDHPEYYGKQRMFGSIGWAISMFIIGIALDHSLVFTSHPCGQTDLHEKNYTTCFAAFSVLMGCALICAFLFKFDTGSHRRTDEVSAAIMDTRQTEVDPAVAENARARAPEPQQASVGPRWVSVVKTFGSPHYACLLVVAWWLGIGVGLVFCFLFWHLQDIGGSPTLYGFASVVNHFSEIFAYFFSYRLINKLGHIKVIYLGLIANVCRFLYASWLTDPWWILPFEFVQGITHAVVWAALTSYISLASPPQYKLDAQGMLQNLHNGLGRACGNIFGGVIIAYYGTQITFRFYGLACLVLLIGFYAINRFFKVSGFKYQTDGFDDDIPHKALVLDPHGIPMMVPYSRSEEKLAPVNNMGYGAMDATQEAYDRYIHEPYEKPVKFEPFPTNFGKR